jgi:hypothetical protein
MPACYKTFAVAQNAIALAAKRKPCLIGLRNLALKS